MNKSYRLVYSEVTNTWVAVSELTKAKGKKSSLKTIGSVLATSIMATFGLAQAGTIALNLPVGTITYGAGVGGVCAQNSGDTTFTCQIPRSGGGFATLTGVPSIPSGIPGVLAADPAAINAWLATNSGLNSIALGTLNTSASGADAVAIGTSAKATGKNTISMGNGASASSTSAIAIGTGATAKGLSAYALGESSQAIGSNSVALGADSQSNTQYSFAAGRAASATGQSSVALGGGAASGGAATANGTGAIAIGGGGSTTDGAVASNTRAIAIGVGAKATGQQSISIGTGNKVSGNNSGAIGDPSIINGANSYSVGNNNTIGSTTTDAFALGNGIYLGATSGGVDTTSVTGAVALAQAQA